MNLAVIGSGGREHAICYKLKLSTKLKKLICIPGNAGTEKIAENINEDILNFEAIYKIIQKHNIDIVIIGPEQPLVNGLSDYLSEKKIRVFGPDKFCSQLEGSKAFMKKLCKENKIPTADFKICNKKSEVLNFLANCKLPVVVKADGLAAGKGVSICKSKKQVLSISEKIFNGKFESSKKLVLEEFLDGEEASYFLVVDNLNFKF